VSGASVFTREQRDESLRTMAKTASITEYLSQTVVSIEGTIPAGMTVSEWRRQRRHLPPPGECCDQLCDTTTRYEHDKKLLHFLLFCPECGTEKLIETVPYEPRFEPNPALDPAEAPAAAKVQPLPLRRRRRGTPDRVRRAA
jgi:hypothetical protein